MRLLNILDVKVSRKKIYRVYLILTSVIFKRSIRTIIRDEENGPIVLSVDLIRPSIERLRYC